jgi:hypothetical protein
MKFKFNPKALNPMALKDVDWKRFFIEKGERVGLGIAGFLMVVITGVSLFLPDHGFLVPAPTTNAKDLNDISDRESNRQRSAVPGEADKPPPIPAVPVSFENNRIDDGDSYRVTKLFIPPPADSTKRRVPELYQPDEATAAVAFSQVRSFIFSPVGDNEYGNIMILEGDKGATISTTGGGNGPSARVLSAYTRNPRAPTGGIGGGGGPGQGGGGPIGMGRGAGAGGGPIGIGGQPGAAPGMGQGGGGPVGMGGGGGMLGTRQTGALRPGQVGGAASDGKAVMTTRYVKVDEITENNLPHFAERVVPLRQALIVAAFPYRKQIEEFQRKLRLPSAGSVLSEQSEEKDADGAPLPSFRFLGVDVQRRVLDPDGKPVQEWQPLDLTAAMKPFVIANGARFEDDPKEPRELAGLMIDGLWMPLLKQFTEENRYTKYYPSLELQLKHIQKTIEDLKGKEVEKIYTGANPILDKDDFNPFRARQTSRPKRAAKPATEAATPPAGNGQPGYQPGGSVMADGTVVPEYVLVRVVDVNIEPGKIYEYRLHVRMANPNYKRNGEVLSPSYAVDQELVPAAQRKDSDWFVVPKKVSVPPEFYYYAVDQKDLEGNLYQGIHARDQVYRDQQTVFQIHRWLDDASRGGNLPMWVGEWVVAERVLVAKGEYIGRTESVNVPVWSPPAASFVLAAPPPEPGVRRKVSGIDVEFSLPNDDAILVDFEGGMQVYKRKSRRDDRSETVKVEDRTSQEVLVVSSVDGHDRVMARDTVQDAFSKERNERLLTWRSRIRDLILANRPTITPFGPTGTPGGVPPGGAPGGPAGRMRRGG